MIAMAGWVILNKEKHGKVVKNTIHGTLPSSVANVLVGEQYTPKTIFLKIISPRKPYLYLTIAFLILIVYRAQFFKVK